LTRAATWAASGGAPAGAGTRTGAGVRGLGVGVADGVGVALPDGLDELGVDTGGAVLGVVGLGRPQPTSAATSMVAATAAASTRSTGKGQPS